MITRPFISVLLLILVSCFMTFCSSNDIKSNILLDLSDHIKDPKNSRERIDATIMSFMENSSYNGNNQPVTLYYEHFFRKGTYEFATTINRVKQVRSHSTLLINVKEHVPLDHVNDMTTFVRNRYSGIFRIIAENIFISGLSFEFDAVRSSCSVNSPKTNTTLIEEVQQLLRSFTTRDLKIGYKLSLRQLKCRGHSRYIENSNYLIFNIPFKRNDKEFVESFDVFKNNMRIISTRAIGFVHSLFGGNYTRPVYYKLTLSTSLIFDNVDSRRCIRGILTPLNQELIKMASENIVNAQDEYLSRYENLLVQYCRQLGEDGQDATFILKFPIENSDTPQALVIPQMPILPVIGLGTSGMRSISFLLEEIASSGFNTIIINGDIWQEMIRKGISKSNCYNEQCRPENVWYLNDKHYAFSNYDTKNITSLLKVDGMHLRAIVFSRYYKENNKLNCKTVVESLRIEAGCTELTDIFGQILNNGTFGIFCHSWILQRSIGCGSLERSSNIIVWRGVLVFNVYSVYDFVENTIKKLDALVLGRQILRNRRKDDGQNANVEIVLRIEIEYDGKGRTVIGNHMYCTDLSTIIYQFYEILLTWAKIHDFTMILEPIRDDFGYDNPISWKRLEISSTGHMRNLMYSFPIFIRRSYNTSRVFGSWTQGMYPCIQQSKDLESIKEVDFLHPLTGSTIYFNVRADNTNINNEELQVMLLLAFGKFSTVELIIRSQSDLQILYDTVLQTDFDQNLKANNVSKKNVYVDVSISLSEQLIKNITEIVKILEKNYIQVQTHHPNDGIANIFGLPSGKFIKDCTATANALLTSHFEEFEKIRYAKYIVCDTSPINAQNEDTNSMRDYLDSHLYLQKVFKYLFRNITGVYFRLHPQLVGNTFEEQSRNLLLFLTDIHKYATAYNIHYFLLPVLPQENEQNMASFWTTTNYENLVDITSFVERQANLLGLDHRKPIIVNQVEFNIPTISSTEEMTTVVSSLVTEYSLVWNSSTENTNSTYVELIESSLSTLEYTLIFVGSLATFVFIIFILRLLTNRRHGIRKRIHDFFRNRTETRETHALELNQDNERYSRHVVNDSSKAETATSSKSETSFSQNCHKIRKKNIEIYYDKILGSGEFGIVYRAKLKDSPFDVAVKMMHENSPQESLKGMWGEVNLLCGIGKHCNAVGFIGCYYEEIRKGVLWIITELCPRGSLLSFLRDVEAENLDVQLSRRELFKFCLEIAQGMEYIETKNIIHGDLSTRNVLLDENYTCKIGDFGLSRKLYRYEMYVKTSQEPLPWRWMAYESLMKLQFSAQSDVWSYGVTIWEIFTLGNVPYPGMTWSFDFLAEIENGLRLPSPKYATRNVNAMMQKCWELKPKTRPSFTELVKFFSDLLEINCEDDDKIIQV